MRTQYVDSVSLSDIARVLVALWLFGCLQLRNTTTPTRASRRIDAKRQKNQAVRSVLQVARRIKGISACPPDQPWLPYRFPCGRMRSHSIYRSEEHTSELQS